MVVLSRWWCSRRLICRVDVGAAVAVLREHSSQALAVVAVDARKAEPVVALYPWLLPGRTVALLGSSGAGEVDADEHVAWRAAYEGW